MPGYGILLEQVQLDEVEGCSNGSPTRLIRNLLSAFFSREELALSSCYGSRVHRALDKDIVLACLSESFNMVPAVRKKFIHTL